MTDEVKINRPSYAANFECIGPHCEDTCCVGWDIPLDRETYQRYLQFPPEPLGKTVQQYVQIETASSSERMYAYIKRTEDRCAFLDADQLCGVQKNYGGDLLSATCSIYPRVLNEVDDVFEGSLMMSCPEAARKILLVPGSTQVAGDLAGANFRKDILYGLSGTEKQNKYKPAPWYREIRDWAIAMIEDRTRPLWQRLLMIGSLCARLSAIENEQQAQVVPGLLEDYRKTLGTTWGVEEMNRLTGPPEARVRLITRLTELVIWELDCRERFRWTYSDFKEGIQNDVSQFLEADTKYFQPFFDKYPFILENFLINYIYKNLFPFGRVGSFGFVERSIFEEFLVMAIQFGWIEGLLVGVAGKYKEGFGADQVIKAIQSISREVEHAQPVLTAMLDLLKNYQMDSLHGMAILLRA